MRQLMIQVPRGNAQRVLDIARRNDALDAVATQAMRSDAPLDVIQLNISNSKLEVLLGELEAVPGLHVSFAPRGVLALRPPTDQAAEQVTDVELLSPLEIFLGGLQSVGSWRGFTGYAVVAGVIVWIGLFTNTSYLLVAAMLIAPYAGPAMNVALGSAAGDETLIRRGLLRYVAALALSIATAFSLSILLGQDMATDAMVAVSKISSLAILLPLFAGAAGALNLIQSERSSLVSGAATGMLVASSLAPPAGVVGMAAAIGRGDMVVNAVFLLVLQLVGIELASTLLLRLHGLMPRLAQRQRGKRGVFAAALGTTLVALAGLLTWQFTSDRFRRPSEAQRATALAAQAIEESGLAYPVEVDLRFTRPSIPGQRTLLGVIYVQRRVAESARDRGERSLEQRLERRVQDTLRAPEFDAVSLVRVIALDPPSAR